MKLALKPISFVFSLGFPKYISLIFIPNFHEGENSDNSVLIVHLKYAYIFG